MIGNVWTNLGVFATVSGVVITVLLLVVKLIYQIGIWKERLDCQEKATTKISDKIEQVKADFDDKIEQVKVDLGEIKVNAKETTTKLDLIYNFLKINTLAKEGSPLKLTDKGEIVRKEIKADEIFEKYKYKLISAIDKEKEKHPYDIQQEAYRVINDVLPKLLDENELSVIKSEAFKLGRPISDVLAIFKILLRDFLLKKGANNA